MSALTQPNIDDIVKRLSSVAHDTDTTKFDNVVEALKNQYRLEESTLHSWAESINGGRQGQIGEDMARAIEKHGKSGWEQYFIGKKHAWQDTGKTFQKTGQAVSEVAEVTGAKAAGRFAKNTAGKAWGGLKGLGKIAGIGAAAVVGAGILSTLLSSKRTESAEQIANTPAQPAMDFAPSFGPTGSVPPVEGDFVARYAKGGEMNRTAMPATPDVASRAQAVEQSRTGDASPTLA